MVIGVTVNITVDTTADTTIDTIADAMIVMRKWKKKPIMIGKKPIMIGKIPIGKDEGGIIHEKTH